MPRSAVTFMLALAATAAIADADDLANGVFIAHYVPGFGGPGQPHGCDDYMQQARIETCAEQNETVCFEGSVAYVEWYVLAAWPEEKEFCAAEFGIGDYDPELVHLIGHNPCVNDASTIPSTDPPWPAPNSGIAIAWDIEDAPTGNFAPVYMFRCYVYGSAYGTTTIPIVPNPTYHHFLGFADCQVPPVTWDAIASGRLGIHEPGVWVCPPGWVSNVPDPSGETTPTEEVNWGRIKLLFREGSCADARGGTN